MADIALVCASKSCCAQLAIPEAAARNLHREFGRWHVERHGWRVHPTSDGDRVMCPRCVSQL